MTALNFLIQKEQICIAMDTLSLSADDRDPLAYATKFIALPHVDMVVSGTGNGQVINEWMALVRSKIVITDIEHLNEYAPNSLAKIMDKYVENEEITATIYHFGYSQARERFVGYAFRSINDWIPEELPSDSIGIKPNIKYNVGAEFQLPLSFIELISRQRELDLELPHEERVGIGGDIHFVHMNGNGINISKCHRFSSYEEDYEKMCENL